MIRRITRRLSRPLLALALALTGAGVAVVVAAPAAHADACYSWSRTLKPGMAGEDVRQLQIRVAGWVAHKEVLVIDGDFGEATKRAVIRFQQGYGLLDDGDAGPQTFGKIYELQDNDCTPIHFNFSELDNNCGANNYVGGKVNEATAKANALQVMWKLEAMRHKLGDRPITVNGGFRSISCNSSVGGASDSSHLYGKAADIDDGPISYCDFVRAAIRAGFNEIYGPGYPGHNDHVHLGNRSSASYGAPNCGSFP